MNVEVGKYLISTDPDKLDIDAIHAFLVRSYWAEELPRQILERAIAHSLCFGVYDKDRAQVGFARVITDQATYGYIADVYILERCRGLGLSKALMKTIMGHPDLQGFRKWSLMTRDAHGLYRQFGFGPPKNPDRYMEIRNPNVYKIRE